MTHIEDTHPGPASRDCSGPALPLRLQAGHTGYQVRVDAAR